MPTAVRNALTPPPDRAALALGLGRSVLAGKLLAAPVRTLRVVGVDVATARRVSWLTRTMAVRDAALGVGCLVAVRRGGDPTPWIVGGAVADALDAVVIAQAVRTGRLGGVAPSVIAVGAAGVAGFGAATAVRLRRSCGSS